jgi:hypothetical protein
MNRRSIEHDYIVFDQNYLIKNVSRKIITVKDPDSPSAAHNSSANQSKLSLWKMRQVSILDLIVCKIILLSYS